jgi:hypothetical protein
MAGPRGLINVTLVELNVPMLVAAPTAGPCADPETVRLVGLARAGDRTAFGREHRHTEGRGELRGVAH